MPARSFTCRALLVVLLWEAAESHGTAPFLITQTMWPRGCVVDCHRGCHGTVCGSNGRLYKSLCAFRREQCVNTQLSVAPRAHCSDPSLSKCQLARAQALEASARSGGSHAAAMFVPVCHPDGHFLPVQCHNQSGYCWCSTPDGQPLSGTSVFYVIPNCTDHIGEPGPTLKPRKPAELTAPAIWVTLLMNSVRRPTDSHQMCERTSLLSLWQEERFIPECTADGLYSPVQCHVATGYCWCVRAQAPLNRIPDCTGAEETETDRRHREKPLPGCPGARKKQFLQSLVRALQLEAQRAGNLSPYPPEAVLRWHFSQLDLDSSGVLSEREARPLRPRSLPSTVTVMETEA